MHLSQAAKFLPGVAPSWKTVSQEQCYDVGRHLFVNAEIKDDRVGAITPQPEFVRFFLFDCQLREESAKERKRRALLLPDKSAGPGLPPTANDRAI